ncbi:M14 family zinc carboxypeptidase [Streptomyces sp. NPDC005385]|uniref:M14 family zinc carboxypeptidase n=1 Tax=Streptomyces sp. NPDC005385 TaxID=3157039 RepID=UPI0033ADD997
MNYPTPADVTRTARALATRHPDKCRLTTIGHSRRGTPLRMLSVGRGPRHALVVAGAHPNEYVGGGTLLALAHRALAGEHPGTVWHLVLCLDPDGARLNEGGHHADTLLDQYRHFFRPAPDEQPEWAPALPRPRFLPESRALLDVIRRIRPYVQISLHSTDIGGTFAQLTRDVPGLDRTLTTSAERLCIPVENAPLDALHWPATAPGVFVLPPPGAPERPTAFPENAHRSTWLAPHAYGGVTAVIEVPVWAATRFADLTPDPAPEQRLRHWAERLRAHTHTTRAHYERARPHLPPPGPDPAFSIRRAIAETLRVCGPLADSWDPSHPTYTPLPDLTRARTASIEGFARRTPLRAAAMLLRLLDEHAPHPATAPQRAELEALITRWCAAYSTSFTATWVPVDRQIEHQVNVTTAAVEAAEGHLAPS